MDNLITIMLSTTMMCFATYYMSKKLLKFKVFNRTQMVICFLLYFILMIGGYLITDNFIKILLTFAGLSFFIKQISRCSINCAILTSFSVLVVSLVSEILYAILIILIFDVNINDIKNTIFADLISNCTISLIMCSIVQIDIVNNKIRSFIDNTQTYKNGSSIIFSSLSLIALSMLLYYMYFGTKSLIGGFLFSLILISIYTIITVSLFNETKEKEKIKTEYEIILQSLSEYEKLYTRQRILNHEFKNDLMVIRGMASKKNKKLLDYIDSVVNLKNVKNSDWMETLKRIPEGGLLGILYYKLLIMDQEKININFEIGRNFRARDYNLLDDHVKTKVCKLLGIYLDNSIQALKELSKKNLSIRIDIESGTIIFNISNNFESSIDISRLFEKGYTTNEKGRGYGLFIAKEILNDESRIINNTNVVGNIFSQEIKIKVV